MATKRELSLIKLEQTIEQRKLLMNRVLTNRMLITGGSIVVFLVLLALIGPLLVTFSPNEMIVQNRLQAPGGVNILGTDEFGRDVLARIIHGSKVTLGVGFTVTAIASLLGMIIGLLASYYRVLDHILMRICDGLMAIPGILLAIALMAAMGTSTKTVIIALSIVFIPNVARVIRSAAIVVREQTYVEAIRAQGASSLRVIWLHIMPNTISPLVVQATFIFADAIITEAALSFLGAGIPAPDPSWGNMLYDGKQVIFHAWWLTVFPGIMVAMSVLGLNLLGDGLRDLLDPHISNAKK